MNDGDKMGLCAGILREAQKCPHTDGGGCPIVRSYGQELAACVAHERSESLDMLSPRERQVHMQLVKGKTNKMIAGELGISERTVEFHRANIMRKLNAASLAELIEKTLSAWGVA